MRKEFGSLWLLWFVGFQGKDVFVEFLDGLLTVKRSCGRQNNRFLSVERGDSGRVVLVDSFVIFCADRILKLLNYCRIYTSRVLLRKAGLVKPIAIPARAINEGSFIAMPFLFEVY
jgi:hypothetical protein